MLKRFQVTNYRTFHGMLSIDFADTNRYQTNNDCLYDGIITKMLVYGRNSSGKTNLGRAITNISSLVILGKKEPTRSLINADASIDEEILFNYLFQFEEDQIEYEYVLNSKGELSQETLFLNSEKIYSIHFDTKSAYFDGLSKLDEGDIVYERYWGNVASEYQEDSPMPFLRWLLNNVTLSNSTHLASLWNYIENMVLIKGSDRVNHSVRGVDIDNFYRILGEDEHELRRFEKYLNMMGVICTLKTKKLPDGNYELYFKHNTLVPFRTTASSGTVSLMNIYMEVFMIEKSPSFLYLDEFDAFYHYEMSENMVIFLKENYHETQIILTTHNTNLMTNRLMRPDCIMILSTKGRLTPLSRATTRELREGHNLEKMYIGGEFQNYE